MTKKEFKEAVFPVIQEYARVDGITAMEQAEAMWGRIAAGDTWTAPAGVPKNALLDVLEPLEGFQYKKRYEGPSRDHRTNTWRLECPRCGHTFVPRTVMSRYELVECPKGANSKKPCGYSQTIDYDRDGDETRLIRKDDPRNRGDRDPG